MKTCPPFEARWLGRLTFEAGLGIQDDLVEQRRQGAIPDQFLLLEHEAVYTIGRTRDQSSLREADVLPHPVFEINRGGQATYHGPGQLVGYPILDLKNYGRDLHRYLRFLEATLIAVSAHFGVTATQKEGLTGLWVGPRKLASLGVGVRHWISMHGFALNVSRDLSGFSHITPCGIAGVEMTSLSLEANRDIPLEDVWPVAETVFRERLRLLPIPNV